MAHLPLRLCALACAAWVFSVAAGAQGLLPAVPIEATSPADRRVALVIGNGAYGHIPSLANPRNDAVDIGKALDALGFTTIVAVDLDRAGMNQALDRFSRIVDRADIALIYYSGHGMQYGGRNYLVPVDARLDSVADVNPFQLMPLDHVRDVLQSVRAVGVIALDACRNNLVEENLKRQLAGQPGASRDAFVSRGLAPMPAGNGLAIIYATQANDVASDGNARNSPFTQAFLRHVGTSDLDLRYMLLRVQDEVVQQTNGRQRPELSMSIVGEFKLKVPPPAPTVVRLPAQPVAPVPPARVPAAEEVLWEAIRDSSVPELFEEFERKFPASAKIAEARSRLQELRKLAAVAPPIPPPRPPDPEPLQPTVGVFPETAVRALAAASERALKPKDTFKECDNCPEMIVVPAGEMVLGSPPKEPEREAVESPQHRVRFSRPFAVGRYAVTFDEWDACVAAGGCGNYQPWDNSWGRGRRPVINVSWSDAKAYVAWLSRATGRPYRLPSEAEREYVTRAGTSTAFWWGASISPRQANYNGGTVYNRGPKGEYRQKTMPVDAFAPNPWGLHQVHGNVWEWVEDCVNDSHQGAATDGSARNSGDCSRRMLRGGSWISSPASLRSASRYTISFDGRVGNVGFRILRTLAP